MGPTRQVAVCLLFLVVAAACGGTSGEQGSTTSVPPTTFPAPTTTPGINTRYTSVFDIRELIESRGYLCTSWQVIPTPTHATERANCTDAVVLSIHSNASQVEESLDVLAALVGTLGLTSVHLVGPNWSVNCGGDSELCEEFIEALGGELRVIRPPVTTTTASSAADPALEIEGLSSACADATREMVGAFEIVFDRVDVDPGWIEEVDLVPLARDLGFMVGVECGREEAGQAVSEFLVWMVGQIDIRAVQTGYFIEGIIGGLCETITTEVELTFRGRAACGL